MVSGGERNISADGSAWDQGQVAAAARLQEWMEFLFLVQPRISLAVVKRVRARSIMAGKMACPALMAFVGGGAR
jgi:hypothetical protein